MSFVPKDLISDPDVVFLDDTAVIAVLKKVIYQKLTQHFTDNPDDHSVNNWHDVMELVISMIANPERKAKAMAVNPAMWNKAFDELVAEGSLRFRAPPEAVEELPDVEGL